jgi:dienelactone hydrolase
MDEKQVKKWVATWVAIGIVIGAIACLTWIGGKKTTPEKTKEISEEVESIPESYRVPNGVGMVEVIYEESDGRIVPGRIYFPLGPTKKHPAVVWSDGWTGKRVAHYGNLKELAEHGYVAMIFKTTEQETRYQGIVKGMAGVWARDMEDAITYLVEESPVKGLVDESKIGVVGHSLGGITASKVAAEDPRVKAAVILSCTDLSKLSDVHIPIQIQTADFDFGGLLTTIENAPSYILANPSKQLIVIQAGTHDFAALPADEFPGWLIERGKPPWQNKISLHYLLAWFDYFLNEEESARDRIITPTEHLSKRWCSKYDLGEGEQRMAGLLVKSKKRISMVKIEEELGG